MVTYIVAAFLLGYACIALESVLKVNKAAPALLMCVACWVLYMINPEPFVSLMHADTWRDFAAHFAGGGSAVSAFVNEHILLSHLGETCEILFFLMGAMTIVEIVDANGGFYFVQDASAPPASASCCGASPP